MLGLCTRPPGLQAFKAFISYFHHIKNVQMVSLGVLSDDNKGS